MTSLEVFFLIAGVASIVAIPLTIIYARRQSQRQKLLAYLADVSPFPLVSRRSLRDYKLTVVFKPEGGPEERVSDAYVHFVRFANFGREPIRREDIAPLQRLELEVKGTRVLDIAVEAVHRGVSNISVEPDIQLDENLATASVDFDFLDYQDGALVRVLTTSRPSEITLKGGIIGMPAGIQRADKLHRRPFLGKVGATLAVAFELSAFVLTAIVFRWVTGSWDHAWLLVLPLVALILPLVIIIVIGETIWPKGGVTFPRELVPHIRGFPHAIAYRQMGAGPIMFEGFEITEDEDGTKEAQAAESPTGEG